MTNGYIQFGVLGGLESKWGVFNATQDENTVMFSKKYYADMLDLKESIEGIIFSKSSDDQLVSSVADELLKLKQLLDMGVLTSDEFE